MNKLHSPTFSPSARAASSLPIKFNHTGVIDCNLTGRPPIRRYAGSSKTSYLALPCHSRTLSSDGTHTTAIRQNGQLRFLSCRAYGSSPILTRVVKSSITFSTLSGSAGFAANHRGRPTISVPYPCLRHIRS